MSGNIAFVNGGQTDEQGLSRHILKFFSAGVMGTGDLAVSQRGAGANNTVDVAVGDILLDSGLGYPYHGWIVSTENVGSITADATNPRNVIIVVYKDNSVVSNAAANNPGALKFKAILGTPSATPADPSDATIQSTVGSTNEWAKLARIALPAGGGTPTITSAMITDLRSFSSFALVNGIGSSVIKTVQIASLANTSWNNAIVSGYNSTIRMGSSSSGVQNTVMTINLASLAVPDNAVIVQYSFWYNPAGNSGGLGNAPAAITSITRSTGVHTVTICGQWGTNDATAPNLTNSGVQGFVRYIA